MLRSDKTPGRSLPVQSLESDLVVIGGGLSGVCCAITAARAGTKVVLVQDRPVLGGNSSSEVRLWVLGATSHMGNNNRWAREGGVIDEILVENTYRNPEGNAIIFDTVLLDKVVSEPNITLLLNTAVYQVNKKDEQTISSVRAFCSQAQNEFELKAPLFCDTSGDGVVGFLAGAAFRMGAEGKEEFGEKFAPTKEYGELLGHSIYFYSKDIGVPVKFVPPSFALTDISKIPRYRSFNSKEYGCRLWWLEYGGRLDTVHQTEEIKWELWKVVYGVWNYIKNSGGFPEAENLTLEWVGTIPGKRESRRFEGDYILKQQDLVEQRQFDDAVAFGGWSIDLHPADGVFSEKPGCNQWHVKGIYQIPYRCLYSRNIDNLFIAGRIISASHVAFGSTRVMGTSAYTGQAVGLAATLCKEKNLLPKDLVGNGNMNELQGRLLANGHYIPGVHQVHGKSKADGNATADGNVKANGNPTADGNAEANGNASADNIANPDVPVKGGTTDLVQHASLTASSALILHELPENGPQVALDESMMQMVPLRSGHVPELVLHAYAESATELEVQLRRSSNQFNHTPENIIEKRTIALHNGRNCVRLSFDHQFAEDGYFYLCLMKNPKVKVCRSRNRVTGVLSLFNSINAAVSNFGKQEPTEDIGVEAFEFWCPKRRPAGENMALKFLKPINVFEVENIRNGITRPTNLPNAWVADFSDKTPGITLEWKEKTTISQVVLSFDTDFDHPMESVLMTHPENIMPFCVRNYRLEDEEGNVLYKKEGNYQTRNIINLEKPVSVKKLTLHMEAPSEHIPAALFEIRCY
ncbi:FAD-dependent oxidoreductase [Flavitalea antarctica]